MSISEVTYYQVVCDACGDKAHRGTWSAWSTPEGATEDAVENDWWCLGHADPVAVTSVRWLVGLAHLCEKHAPVLHACGQYVTETDTNHSCGGLA